MNGNTKSMFAYMWKVNGSNAYFLTPYVSYGLPHNKALQLWLDKGGKRFKYKKAFQ